MRLRALFSEIDDRKCVVLSVVGVDGAQAMYAIFGRRCWYRWRMWEVVLMEGVKRSHIDWCSLKGRRSRCRLKPCLALRVAVVIVMTKSGAARVRGLRIPRPPDASPSWLMSIAEGGIVGWLRREARNVDMMFSMSDVRGPFQSSHFGSGSSMGRLYRISDDRRCGRRWSRHWEKSLSFVCSSVMEVDREVRLSLTAATREERNSFANVVEPTGWPRRRKPVVSSTGSAGADLLVGWGFVENSAIVFVMDYAKVGLVVWMRGREDVPLHEVRIRVFDGLTKHPRDAPMFLSVLHRKGRSGR